MQTNKLKVRSKLWIQDDEGSFLGEGRIRILKAIAEYGSISKAANSMNMSYQKAWKMVQSMNNASGKDFVLRSSGGKGGGGTVLTTEGEKAIALYEKLNVSCQAFLDQEFEKIKKEF